MPADLELTVAPGVTCKVWHDRHYPPRDGCGAYALHGTQEAIISAGLGDREDFAVLPKRVHHFWSGGRFIQTKRRAAGEFQYTVSAFVEYRRPQEDGGRHSVSWVNCHWVPRIA